MIALSAPIPQIWVLDKLAALENVDNAQIDKVIRTLLECSARWHKALL
jgi:hypothetical protein